MHNPLIARAVDHFLAWRLPADFNPDGGIDFDRMGRTEDDPSWPVGTNLLNAIQAKAMLAHVLDEVFEQNRGMERLIDRLIDSCPEARPTIKAFIQEELAALKRAV